MANSPTEVSANNGAPKQGTNWKNLDAVSAYRLGGNQAGDRDWSKWIEDNKSTLSVAVVLLLIALFGGGYLLNSRNKSNAISNGKIYNFQMTTLADFKKDANATKLVGSFKAINQEVGNYVGMVPAAIKTSDALLSKGFKAEALEVLTIGKSISSNEFSQYYINTRLAVVYEDLGKNQEAVDTLIAISKSNVDVFPGKTYVDLGRVYLKLGNKEKAKASFQYVLDKASEDAEFVKMAKLYLATL
jgi:predicted negative regulator of RcsB-dependent stress response